MIPIHREESAKCMPIERCCFCRDTTHFWTSLEDRAPGQQVACCHLCAIRANPEDVPSKQVWLRLERIAHRPTIGELARGEDRLASGVSGNSSHYLYQDKEGRVHPIVPNSRCPIPVDDIERIIIVSGGGGKV